MQTTQPAYSRISNLIFLIMTSKAKKKCYTKFDWLRKNVEPIKFHVRLLFSALDVIVRKPIEKSVSNRPYFGWR